MKSIFIAATALTVTAVIGTTSAHSQARKVCNHNPVCQAERDGVSVEQARKRDQAANNCFMAAGTTEEQWRAYQTDTRKAPGIRNCLARVERMR